MSYFCGKYPKQDNQVYIDATFFAVLPPVSFAVIM